MPVNGNSGKPEPSEPPSVTATRIIQVNTTIRYGFVCSAIVLGLYFIKEGLESVLGEPPWVQVVSLVIVCLIGPTGLLAVVIKSRTQAVRKHHRRVVELEERQTPNRSSSLPEPPKPRAGEQE